MGIGSEIAAGALCRICAVPLMDEPPGHTRLCGDCWEGEHEDGLLEPWERTPAIVAFGANEPESEEADE